MEAFATVQAHLKLKEVPFHDAFIEMRELNKMMVNESDFGAPMIAVMIIVINKIGADMDNITTAALSKM